jgi:thymidylate synthase ThyX
VSRPTARVIADSTSPSGTRLTTLEVRLHRFVLAELNTHRVFSRNSASSRAIPIAKQIERVVTNPALPLEYGSKRAGMQAGPPLDGDDLAAAQQVWLSARDAAVTAAQDLLRLGVHKQVANRLLEPFMWHTVIVSSTDWDGFWAQRCSPLAQPEIRVAAEAMRDAVHSSSPIARAKGDWHLPYITDDDRAEAGDSYETLRRVSAARCGRVSYLTQDGRRDLDEDLALYERFVSADPPHASPLEHVATPAPARAAQPPGNLRGWLQLRHVALVS